MRIRCPECGNTETFNGSDISTAYVSVNGRGKIIECVADPCSHVEPDDQEWECGECDYSPCLDDDKNLGDELIVDTYPYELSAEYKANLAKDKDRIARL